MRGVEGEDGGARVNMRNACRQSSSQRVPVSLEAADRLRGDVARVVLQRELAAAIEVIRLLVLEPSSAVAEDRACMNEHRTMELSINATTMAVVAA